MTGASLGQAILGIDPGTRKVGWALAHDERSAPIALGIEPLETFIARVRPLLEAHPIRAVALGAGTNAGVLAGLLKSLGVPVHLIDETDTTYKARALYFEANPPRGWRRWIPLGLQLPPRPIDDYAALLIARRYIGQGG